MEINPLSRIAKIDVGINKDKISFVLMSTVLIADVVYVKMYSVSVALTAVVMLWIFVMVPNVLVYMRGNGKWKSAQSNKKVKV